MTAIIVTWTCFTSDGIRESIGDDWASHADHFRCVREVHRADCTLRGLRGDYACHGGCAPRGTDSGRSESCDRCGGEGFVVYDGTPNEVDPCPKCGALDD